MDKPLYVLLVEDSEDDALLLMRELRRGGYELTCERVETPEAMEATLEGEAWDVIIADYHLPRFSAPAALEVLRKKELDLPFIVVSGKVSEEAAVEMMRAGAHDYVAKDKLARLIPAIERELREAEVRRDRQRSDAALRESEERFRLLVEGVKDYAIFMLDPEGYITTWNEGAQRINGYEAEEIIGKHFSIFYTEEDLQRGHPEEELHIVAIEGRYEEEGLRVRKDGSHFWASVLITALRDETGELRGFSKVVRDITERKTTEEELSRLASFPILNPNPIVEVDGAGEPTYLNPAAKELFPNLQRSGTRHPVLSSLEAITEEIRRSGGQPFVREVRVGDRYYHQVISRPTGSHLLRIYAIDTTERRRAENALRESEERYRAVIEQAGEGIFLFDARTKGILEANPAFQEMFGYTQKELERTKLYDLVPQDPEGIDRNVERALEQGHLLVGERSYRHKDGSTVDVEVSGSVISYGGKGIICSIVRDIAERKRTERTLQEIRETERNRIARDLHDGVLQELTYASMEAQLVRIISEEQEIGTRLERIIEALQHAGRQLRGAVYNLRSGEDRPLPRLLESLVEQSRKMAPGCKIRLEIEEGFPAVSLGARGVEVLRIVQEALTNARRHSGAEHVMVALRKEGDELVVEVADDGRGFGSDTALGVGMRSMKERAAALGADLEVESELGKGTRVRLRSLL